MPFNIDVFMTTYNKNLVTANALLAHINGDINKVEYSEMEPDLKSSDITKFAIRKQQLYGQKNKLQAEIASASTFHSQILSIREQISEIDKEVDHLDQLKHAASSSRQIKMFDNEKAVLDDEKNTLVKQEKDIGKSAAKLLYF